MPITIAFQSNQLSLRGTEIALYDYALNNEDVLNNHSLIFYDVNSRDNNPEAIAKFKNRFEVIGYNSTAEIDQLLKEQNANLFYTLKAGRNDGLVSKRIPTMVHAVFPTNPSQIHGASFAFISEWLSQQCSNNKIPCVPHIVDLPELTGDLRVTLGIPASAKVIGCYGGSTSFDVPSAIQATRALLHKSPDTYFIFLNIDAFVQHERALFLPGSADLEYKTRFINTCDAMLHARIQGESFGLACAEFSIKNKPVITYAYSKHKHHIDVLGDAGFYYTDAASLVGIVESLDVNRIKTGHWDRYSARYNKHAVMALFDEHLIHAALRNKNLSRPQIDITMADTMQFYALKIKMRLNSLRALQ